MFNIHRKTPVLVSLFKSCRQEVFSCEICNIFKNTFFHRTPPEAASVIFKEMTLYSAFRNYLNFQVSDLVFRFSFSRNMYIFTRVFYWSKYYWNSSTLLKQSPVKLCCGPATFLKRKTTPAQLLPVIFRKIFRTPVLKNTLTHQFLKLFHSSLFFIWIVSTQLIFAYSK